MEFRRVMKHLRDSGRLVLAEDKDGVLWASNSYWAVPLHDRKAHPIAQAVQHYNLPVEPSDLDVFETIRPSGRDVPDMEKVISASRGDGLTLTQEKIQNFAVAIRVGEAMCSVFRRPDDRYVVARNRYLNFVKCMTVMSLDGRWRQGQPLYETSEDVLAQIAWVVHGEFRAVVMPIRCIDQAKAQAA